MKTYKVTFWLNGKFMQTQLQARDYWGCKDMVKSMYPGATDINVSELR